MQASIVPSGVSPATCREWPAYVLPVAEVGNNFLGEEGRSQLFARVGDSEVGRYTYDEHHPFPGGD